MYLLERCGRIVLTDMSRTAALCHPCAADILYSPSRAGSLGLVEDSVGGRHGECAVHQRCLMAKGTRPCALCTLEPRRAGARPHRIRRGVRGRGCGQRGIDERFGEMVGAGRSRPLTPAGRRRETGSAAAAEARWRRHRGSARCVRGGCAHAQTQAVHTVNVRLNSHAPCKRPAHTFTRARKRTLTRTLTRTLVHAHAHARVEVDSFACFHASGCGAGP